MQISQDTGHAVVQEGGVLRPRPREGGDDCYKRGDVVRYSTNFEILALAKVCETNVQGC